jgi:uncharacterized protein (DUF2147 family)
MATGTKRFILGLVSAAAIAAPVLAQKPVTPTGLWQSPGGNTRLRLSKCGPNICGKVAWASPKARADAARGGHPDLVGMELAANFSRTGHNMFSGRVFVPDSTAASTAR